MKSVTPGPAPFVLPEKMLWVDTAVRGAGIFTTDSSFRAKQLVFSSPTNLEPKLWDEGLQWSKGLN